MKVLFFMTLYFTVVMDTPSNINVKATDDWWYICKNCCRTTTYSSNNSPWEQGCKNSNDNYHRFYPCGKAGNIKIKCTSCDAVVYLTPGQSPAASNCCASGGTHNWQYGN